MANAGDLFVLGIGGSHNGSVCLLRNDEILVAVQLERLSRLKRDYLCGAQSSLAIRYCLETADIPASRLNAIAISAQPYNSVPEHDLRRNPLLRDVVAVAPVYSIPHHLAHAYSVFATSGMNESAILVVDGAGSAFEDLGAAERACVLGGKRGLEIISLYSARAAEVAPLEKHLSECASWDKVLVDNPPFLPKFRSFGAMFGSLSKSMFGDINEAGKVMGLAPYGRATIPVDDFWRADGEEFVFQDTLSSRYSGNLWPERAEECRELACSAQRALEEGLLKLASRLRKLTKSPRLCFAGGVALSSVSNERIVRESGFDECFFFPAAEDSGIAVGAAYYALWQLTGTNTLRKLQNDSMGRTYSPADIDSALRRFPSLPARKSTAVTEVAADLLADGKIIGWFTGGSELGPRSLGQRSILCDPRRPDGKEVLNRRIKHREPFRPFAPAVLLDHVHEWFDVGDADPESPFMLRVMPFRPQKRGLVPAVVHVDGTGRLQTLVANNGPFYELVAKFHERTGVPMLLNTSFNVMGEPIVETPADALWCLLSTGLDACVFDDRIVTKDGFDSVLDLYPSLNLAGQPERPAGGPNAIHRIEVITAWGLSVRQVTSNTMAILGCVDGRSNARAWWQGLVARGLFPDDEPRFRKFVNALRRNLILHFAEEPN